MKTSATKKRKNRRVPQRRDFDGMERRRMRAARLFDKGVRQADIARELGVSTPTVSRWYAAWESGGKNALKAAG